MRRLCVVLLWLVVLVFGTACSVTRYIPDGEYLLHKVRIETDREAPKGERIAKDEFAKYIRQTPNKRILGTNFYVWLYEQADTAKHNGWNRWKRRVGQEAVLFDENYTERSRQNLKVFMDSRGFFRSSSSFEVDTTSRPKRAKVTYRVAQREPYLIRSIGYEFRDKQLESVILADTVRTLLKRGDRFDITVLDAERERVTIYLKELGYYNFTVGNIEYIADTLSSNRTVDLKLVVKQHLAGYNERGEAEMEDNLVYQLGEVHIMPDYDPTVLPNTTTTLEGLDLQLDTLNYRGLNIVYDGRLPLRRKVLRRAVSLNEGSRYSTSEVERTYADLTSLGYFRSAKITFREEPKRVEVVDTTRVVDFEGEHISVNRSKEGVLACDILCSPTLKQSFKLELEGSTTSSFYGLKATVGYQNRNIFRGAEALDISFTGGYEFMKAKDAKMRRATEMGVTAGLTFPRFLLPGDCDFRQLVQPKSVLELAINFQDRPYYRRTLTSAGLSYQWSNRRYSSFTLRPIDINVIDVSRLDPTFLSSTQNQYLINSYKTQLMAGLSFSYAYNNQLRNLGGNATVVRFNFESSGNLIDLVEHAFSDKRAGRDYYTLFGIRYSQYVRADVSLSRKLVLGEKTAIAGRIYGGLAKAYGNSDAVPFDRLFYAGGSNSMRGWGPRMLGPGSVPDPDSDFPTQLGDMKLEANLEFRFPIWGIVHGATFLDLGNIWYMKSNPDEYAEEAVFHFDNFYKQLGFNTGLGIRLDIKFAVLRLDWGVQLHNPNRPAGERWISNFRWKNTALNFGVGYPF
ncbi:MAG: BamA/TamA family outer membrane protein [Rikenellaceae bacterium]|nr:BamA/TamA family outer membrane protein [Rikenellaceae bacterium]